MRPRYETEADRERERDVLAAICLRWDCVARKLPVDGHTLDYELINPGGRVIAEIKCRPHRHDYYDTYMISLGKVRAGGPFGLLIVQFSDGIYWLRFGDKHITGLGGRRDRGDPADIEDVALYPVEQFRYVRGT